MITSVITNFNQGKFIESALNSLLGQIMLPSEIIVVDDKSTDNSVELIEKCIGKYTGPIPIHFVKRETNGKPGGARNSAIKIAKGDIITFLDIDDYYYKDKIQKSVEVLEKNPEVGLVYSDYDKMDLRSGKTMREFKHPYDFALLWQTCIVSTNSVIRAEVFKEGVVGLFNEKYLVAEDYEMWLRIARKYILWHIPEPLFMYRLHGENLTIKYGYTMNKVVEEIKRNYINEHST